MAFWLVGPAEGSSKGCSLHLSCVCTSAVPHAPCLGAHLKREENRILKRKNTNGPGQIFGSP